MICPPDFSWRRFWLDRRVPQGLHWVWRVHWLWVHRNASWPRPFVSQNRQNQLLRVYWLATRRRYFRDALLPVDRYAWLFQHARCQWPLPRDQEMSVTATWYNWLRCQALTAFLLVEAFRRSKTWLNRQFVHKFPPIWLQPSQASNFEANSVCCQFCVQLLWL